MVSNIILALLVFLPLGPNLPDYKKLLNGFIFFPVRFLTLEPFGTHTISKNRCYKASLFFLFYIYVAVHLVWCNKELKSIQVFRWFLKLSSSQTFLQIRSILPDLSSIEICLVLYHTGPNIQRQSLLSQLLYSNRPNVHRQFSELVSLQ